MGRRKLTTHLLTLADNDDFSTALHILLSTNTPSNRRTKSGDYLITLAAFTACERGAEYQIRIHALKCLIYILDQDFTAVNKVALDGGSALHCALAAASCFEECDVDNKDDNDDCSEDSFEGDSDDDSDEEEEDDDDTDKEFLRELKSKALEESSLMDNYHEEVVNLSSDEIIVVTIYLLLSYEADVNLPLANVNNLSNEQIDNADTDDDDKIFELAFSRESIIKQWTPLMFGLQMIILASKESEEKRRNRFMAVSLLIIHLLVESGADPFYMMATKTASNEEWNAFHVLNSAYHLLGHVTVNPEVCSLVSILQNNKIQILNMNCTHHEEATYAKLEKLDQYGSMYECVDNVIFLKTKDRQMSAIQCFTSAILKNNAFTARSLLQELENCFAQSRMTKGWHSVIFSSVFPLLQSVWNTKQHSTMTIFDVAAFCCATDSVKFLIECNPDCLSEEEMKNSVKFALLNAQNFNHDDQPSNNLIDTLQILLAVDKDDDDIGHKRQRVLDLLLLECCTHIQWTQHSTMEVLLQLGADPNIASILNTIQDSLTPLHLIAGNQRGDDGIIKLNQLFGQRKNDGTLFHNDTHFEEVNLYAKTSETNRIPLEIALEKKNHHVVKHLFDAMNMEVNDSRMVWDLEKAFKLGEAAIECTSSKLFEATVQIMNVLVNGENITSLNRHLGKLLLLALDERSSFGRKLMSIEQKAEIQHTLFTIVQQTSEFHEKHSKIIFSKWIQDKVSGHTLLHHLLRNDRGLSLRKLLLHPLCTLLARDDDRNTNSTNSENIISLPCDEKFGSYTALHLACALGCEESIKTLILFNANIEALSVDGNKPINMIPETIKFSKEIIDLLFD